MHKLKISIKTLLPVVLSTQSNSTIMTETHAAFSGSIIHGVLGARYLALKKILREAINHCAVTDWLTAIKFTRRKSKRRCLCI